MKKGTFITLICLVTLVMAVTGDLVLYFASGDVETRIINDYHRKLIADEETFFGYPFPSDIYIKENYGTYNNTTVVVIGVRFKDFYPTVVTNEMIIAGLHFGESPGNEMLVWNDGKFYDLFLAYEYSLLTENDIKTIHELRYPNRT